jgi:hypothetical protein
MKIVLGEDTAIYVRFICQRMDNDGAGNNENGRTVAIEEDNMGIMSRDGEYGEMADGVESNFAVRSRDGETDETNEDENGRTVPSAIC